MDENKYNLNALETRVGNVETKNEEQDLTISEFDIFPLGSIIPWVNKPSLGSVHQEDLPDGWVLCDGGVIPQGVWQGEHTPDLNGDERFLRGGSMSQVLTLEEHMVQDHMHQDPGHSHTDTGHGHTYYQGFVEHIAGCGVEGCNDYRFGHSEQVTVNSHANIEANTSNHGGLATGNKGSETRPVNMRVIWILKAW